MRHAMTAFGVAGAITIGAFALAHGARAGEADGATAEAALADDTSAACFNAALHKKGATVDYDEKVFDDDPRPARHIVTDVRGRKSFEGVDAIETRIRNYDDEGKVGSTDFIYGDVKNDFIFEYGVKYETVTRQYKPSVKLPTALKKGEKYQSDFKVVSTGGIGEKYVQEIKSNVTFKGIESVKFKVGTFKACRFEGRSFVSNNENDRTYFTKSTNWVAAEGKYRGFRLKAKVFSKFSDGGAINQRIEVTQIRAFDVK